MYPLLRLTTEMMLARKARPLSPFQAHVSTHRCWPWDLDPWIELNNGRTLTLYDLGRLPMAARTGMIGIMRRNRWSITVAGNSVRYRRRIRAFDRFTMVTRLHGWDERFFYLDQSIWRRGECANHMLLRGAITSDAGIVAPERLFQAGGMDTCSPPLPGWVQAWIRADAERPWPPALAGIGPDAWTGDLPPESRQPETGR